MICSSDCTNFFASLWVAVEWRREREEAISRTITDRNRFESDCRTDGKDSVLN